MISKDKLAVIHIAKAEARFDDELYRAFLHKHAGVRSASDLTDATFDKVMRAFEKETGFVSTAKKKKRSKRNYQANAPITREQQELIQKLYSQLDWTATERQIGFNKRCTRKSFPQTRSDGNKVIEGLKAVIERGARARENQGSTS